MAVNLLNINSRQRRWLTERGEKLFTGTAVAKETAVGRATGRDSFR